MWKTTRSEKSSLNTSRYLARCLFLRRHDSGKYSLMSFWHGRHTWEGFLLWERVGWQIWPLGSCQISLREVWRGAARLPGVSNTQAGAAWWMNHAEILTVPACWLCSGSRVGYFVTYKSHSFPHLFKIQDARILLEIYWTQVTFLDSDPYSNRHLCLITLIYIYSLSFLLVLTVEKNVIWILSGTKWQQ